MNGTTTEWIEGRTVLTEDEWNNLQGNNTLRFRVQAESREGVWVEEPAQGTIESCEECKFMYLANILMYTTWNMFGWDDANSVAIPETPSVLTSGLYDNYEELIATTGKSYFLGVKLNSNNEVTNAYACGVKDGTPFCIEGYSDNSKYNANKTLLNGANLYNNTCTETVADEGTENEYRHLECGPWDNSGSVSADADTDGYVRAGVGDDDICYVNPDGYFVCFESEADEPGPSGPDEPIPFEPGGSVAD